MSGWIGVDLDGTLAYDNVVKHDPYKIGEPVPTMLAFVKELIAKGEKVKIFTARMHVLTNDVEKKRREKMIQDWCVKHGLGKLEVTNIKSTSMKALYDDRAFHVVRNTGEVIKPQ